MNKILRGALNKWGAQMQMILTMEDLAELTKEISKHIRGFSNNEEIAEEIADVEIMLEQLKLIFNNSKAISHYKEIKLIRLEQLINGGG